MTVFYQLGGELTTCIYLDTLGVTYNNEDWNIMLLENINIEIPSDDWVLSDHQEFDPGKDSDESPSYHTDIKHLPTGLVVTASGYTNFTYSVVYPDRHADVPKDEQDAVLESWNEFVVESLPALRTFHHGLPNLAGLEFLRTMYDKDNLDHSYIVEGVVKLFSTDFKRGHQK